ncbi:MAG TPA: hypothetical protein DCR93_21005, partial [Cytophagales bacterium]|nr:hypothetical protein [Cytophagales bacterium]
VDALAEQTGWTVIDLNDYQISPYDYEHRNRDDDYLGLMRRIIEDYDTLVLATPVYWYAMSSTMKVFFDRLTDLLRIEKDLGRKLRGKSMAVLTSSAGGNLGEQFWLPFTASAEYLGMESVAHLHTEPGGDHTTQLSGFVRQVESARR